MDSLLVIILAIIFNVCGVVILYATSAKQKLLAEALPRRTSLSVAGISFLASFLLMQQVVSIPVTIFIFFILAMMLWSLLPIIAAYLDHRRPDRHG